MQIFDSGLPIADFISSAVLTTVAFIIVLKGKKSPFLRLNDAPVLFCYALLFALAVSKCSHFIDAHSVLSITTLPVLSQYASGYYPFQLANVYSIYRAINENDRGLGHIVLSVVLHSYIIYATMNKGLLMSFADIKDILFSTEARRLLEIQKTRDVVYDDLKELPEKLCLQNAVNEFKYDVNKPFFLFHTLIRTHWQPMLRTYIVLAIMSILDTIKHTTTVGIMYFIDSPSSYRWYSGYGFIILEYVLIICHLKLEKIQQIIDSEADHLIEALKLHLFRLPLLNKGIPKYVVHYSNITKMLAYLHNTQLIVSSTTKMLTVIIPLYYCVGWLALIPIGTSLVLETLKRINKKVFGIHEKWKSDSNARYSGKINDIYHNIKSIKMFGWEKAYTDPKIQQYWGDFDAREKNSWYAPIAGFAWFIYDVVSMISHGFSSFLVFYLHFKANSRASQLMSAAYMFWMDMLIVQVHASIDEFRSGLKSLSLLIYYVYYTERMLKGELRNALPHYQIDETDQQVAENSSPINCSKSSVCINSGEFSWNKDGPVLKNISFSVDQGEIIAVVGATGSGKSSLLLSICGEVEMTGGEGAVVGSMALVEQTPWIMNGTLRENILFGREYDEEYYNKVIYACALVEDINNWVGGDLTVIGERGINISCGQKARLALARAVYSRADIFVLDDPLSAVDAHVKRHLLDHVIMDSGLLAGKIRIMSLNSKSLLPYFDKVLSLDDNKCVNVTQNTRQDYQSLSDNSDVTLTDDEADAEESNVDSDSDQQADLPDEKITKSNADNSETTKKWSNWDHAKFVLKMCGAPTLAIILCSALLNPVPQFIIGNYKMSLLHSNHSSSNIPVSTIQLYLLIGIVEVVVEDMIGYIEKHINGIISEKYLSSHIKSLFVERLIHVPLSFFDSTTRHEISSAYNNGTEAMAEGIPEFLRTKTSDITSAVLSIYTIMTNAPLLLILVPVFTCANMKYESMWSPIQDSFEKINTQMSIDREKVNDTIEDGKVLIRIFDIEKYFIKMYMDKNDKEGSIELSITSINRYLLVFYNQLYYMAISLCKMAAVIQIQVFQYKLSSITVNNLIDKAASLDGNVKVFTSFKADAIRFRNRIETFRQYIDIDGEKMFTDNATIPEEQWPAAGKIELCDFSMKYHEDLEYVLKDINLTINPGERIGIVGRTGAGKTSLTRALFRLVDSKTCDGSIVIDGHDIFSLNIGDLRPKLGIIPQEPTMFEGSFRQNLDPLVKYNIEDMWSAIIKCGIVENVQPKDAYNSYNEDWIDEDTLDEIKYWEKDWEMANWKKRILLYLFIGKPKFNKADAREVRPHGLRRHAGDSFSDGQQQIFGLCRLLMRNRKIIVLDEATANVDMETDQNMQKLIRSEFKDCTVLTIAHRLETIMNSDRIIVMDKGRIAEIGSPAELLENKGHFAELVKASDFGQ